MARAGKLIREWAAAEALRNRLATVHAPCGHSINEFRAAWDQETRTGADEWRCRQCGATISDADLRAAAA
jgi:hypothetical protein